jgi:hypothetical protein
MSSRTTRKVLRVGDSKGITLPYDWVANHPDCQHVHLVYDDVILIFREDQAARVDALFEQLIAKVATESLTHQQQEMRPHGRPAAASQP